MKKNNIYFDLSILLFSFFIINNVNCFAEEENFSSITLTPEKYVTVNGDAAKFRAHQWMNDSGYSAGVKELIIKRLFDDDTTISFTGHALPDENDTGAAILLEREGVGIADIQYSNFRKYYDNSGGYYYPFTTLASSDLDENLKMDIGRFSILLAPDIGDINTFSFQYEHNTKNGKKSRLNWADAREGAVIREISPTWQSLDEDVDILTLNIGTQIADFNINTEQKYEQSKSRAIRHERLLSTSSTASQNKTRNQDQFPEAKIFTSTFSGDKWSDDETSFVNIAYRYNLIDNKMLENIVEADASGVPTNFSNPKTVIDATANNDLFSHILVGHYVKNITPNFRVSAKSRNEYVYKEGFATYPKDSSPASSGGSTPDGVVDAIDYNSSTNKVLNFGQDFGFQYTGIKRMSLYGDVELSQVHNRLKEFQENIARLPQWERLTVADTTKTTWTLGTRYAPLNKISITTQLRRKFENNDFDDKIDTAGRINSAFFDSLKIITNEITSKVTWKTLAWLHNSIRYQFNDKKYNGRFQVADNTQESRSQSHTFTYDVFIQAFEQLFFNFSYSFQNAKTSTPAAASSNVAVLPGFNADVNNFLFSGSYSPTSELNIIGAFGYTFSDNFNDYTAGALPLGVSNNYKTVEFGMQWTPKDKNWQIFPHYAYYDYDTSSVAEFGDYTAHVAWLDFKFDW